MRRLTRIAPLADSCRVGRGGAARACSPAAVPPPPPPPPPLPFLANRRRRRGDRGSRCGVSITRSVPGTAAAVVASRLVLVVVVLFALPAAPPGRRRPALDRLASLHQRRTADGAGSTTARARTAGSDSGNSGRTAGPLRSSSSTDRAAVVQLRELVRVRVLKRFFRLLSAFRKLRCVRTRRCNDSKASFVLARRRTSMTDSSAVDVPYVHVVEELARLHAELRDQRDVIERVGRAR